MSELSELLKESETILNAYKTAYKQFVDRKDVIQNYHEQFENFSWDIEPEEKAEIDRVVKDKIGPQIAQWKVEMDELEGEGEGSVVEAENVYGDKQKKVEMAQKNYDKLKNLQKETDAALKKLEELQKSIEDEGKKNGRFKDVNTYILKEYLGKLLPWITFTTVATLEADLDDVQTNLTMAKKDLKAAEEEKDKRKNDRDKLKEDEKKRKEDILDEIHLKLLQLEPTKPTSLEEPLGPTGPSQDLS